MEQRTIKQLALLFPLFLSAIKSFAMMQDFFSEASSANQNRGATSLAPNEIIDTFSGGLSLVHTDLVVPGNGGMDIRVQRSYSSNNVYVRPIGGMGSTLQNLAETNPYGMGWSMHFGRVRISFDYWNDGGWDAFQSCADPAVTPNTLDNPFLEMPDGSQRQLFCNDFPSTYSTSAHFITKDNWVVTPIRSSPTSGTTGFLVIDPQGMKYTMNKRITGGTIPLSQYVFYTTKIEDKNSNQINIEYDDSLSGNESPVYKRVTSSDGRIVEFNYTNKTSPLKVQLRSVKYKDRTLDYVFNSYIPPNQVFGGREYRTLRSVSLPGSNTSTGAWNYSYHTKQAGQAGNAMLKTITYPQGATTTYDYTYQCLMYSSCSSLGQYVSIVVSSKVNAGRGIATGNWSFGYTSTSDENFQIVTVTGPTTVEESRHFKVKQRVADGVLYTGQTPNLWRVGLLDTKTTKNRSGSVLQVEKYTYDKRTISNERYERFPYTFSNSGLFDNKTYQHFLTQKTVTRDGANYITRFENFSDNISPHKISEIGQATRITNYTYYPRLNGQNIVGMPKDEVITNAANRKITRTFDTKGNLKTETQYGVLSTFTYDNQGNVASRKDARNNTTSYSNYFRGIPRTESRPEGVTIRRSVDDFGNVTRVTDGKGFITNYTYDPLNRPTKIDKPEGADTTISWTTSKRTVTRGAYSQVTNYDGLGRTSCTNTEGIYVGSAYDAVGNMTYQTYPSYSNCSFASRTRFTYDGLNRKLRTTHADNSYQEVTFLSGNRQRLRDERGKLFTNAYRSFGNPDNPELIGITGPESLDVDISRNLLGQVTGVSRNSVSRSYDFGSSIFLLNETNPETGVTAYGRDAIGNMTSKKVGNSGTTTYTYDKLNRLKVTNFPSTTPDITRTYDNNSNITRVLSGIADLNYSFDENNNLISERQKIAGVNYFINYTYNDLDYISSITNPDTGVINYAPNALGWPTKAAPFVTQVVYNASGQPASIEYQNGRKITHTYDVRRWPKRTIVDGGISDRERGYDPAGNLLSLNDRIANRFDRAMSYDDLNRLESANGAWGTGSIAYNGSDDITSKRMGTNNLGYSYGSANRKLSSVSGIQNFITAAQYAYDVYGNVTKKSNSTTGWTYEYDDASNLRKVFDKAGNELRQYDYSGMKQRVRSTKPDETRIHIVGREGQLLGEYVTQGTKPNIVNVYLGNRLVAELESGASGPPATLFGWGFGNSANKYDYSRTFNLDEIPDRFEYCVDGYGIDSNTEVSVKLNGVQIGFLKAGGNPTETCFEINPNRLRLGVNTVLFTQTQPVQTWGVGNFVASPFFNRQTSVLPPIIMLLLDDEPNTANAQPATEEAN